MKSNVNPCTICTRHFPPYIADDGLAIFMDGSFCSHEIKCTTTFPQLITISRTSTASISLWSMPRQHRCMYIIRHLDPPRRTRTSNLRLSYYIPHYPHQVLKCIIVVFIHLVLTTPSLHLHTLISFLCCHNYIPPHLRIDHIPSSIIHPFVFLIFLSFACDTQQTH